MGVFCAKESSRVCTAVKIMPLCVLGLILTGGMMMSAWVGSNAGGYFETPLQRLLMLKILLAVIITGGVVVNLSMKAIGKEPPSFIKKYFHKFVLITGFLIVALAKMMFAV